VLILVEAAAATSNSYSNFCLLSAEAAAAVT